ncbi:MAG TPA: GNAT family N-acetyltransferase [Gaiellaceae bacterium]
MSTIEDGSDQIELVRELFREYGDSLDVDLCFQGFETELEELPWEYVVLLVGRVDGDAAGCVGVRRLDDGACELKRLYVRPTARGSGLGRRLTEAAIDRARELGFQRMRLDTLPSMDAARALYATLGFVEIGAYRPNPVPGVMYLELTL